MRETKIMHIRLATGEDMPALMGLVRRVVPLMRAAGNPQWDETYPNETVLQRDIDLGQLWVAEADTGLAGVAAITYGDWNSNVTWAASSATTLSR